MLVTVGLEPKTFQYIPGLHLYSAFPIYFFGVVLRYNYSTFTHVSIKLIWMESKKL
jgi:hypothetical protein